MAMKNDEIEDEIRAIKEMIAEIHAVFVIGSTPGRYEFQRAMQEFAKGNRKPFELYVKRGGKPHDLTEGKP